MCGTGVDIGCREARTSVPPLRTARTRAQHMFAVAARAECDSKARTLFASAYDVERGETLRVSKTYRGNERKSP